MQGGATIQHLGHEQLNAPIVNHFAADRGLPVQLQVHARPSGHGYVQRGLAVAVGDDELAHGDGVDSGIAEARHAAVSRQVQH